MKEERKRSLEGRVREVLIGKKHICEEVYMREKEKGTNGSWPIPTI